MTRAGRRLEATTDAFADTLNRLPQTDRQAVLNDLDGLNAALGDSNDEGFLQVQNFVLNLIISIRKRDIRNLEIRTNDEAETKSIPEVRD